MKRRDFMKTTAIGVTAIGTLHPFSVAGERHKEVDENMGTFLLEPEKKVPVVGEYDVCVLGGSCTGVFAAVRAAQMGAKVALVEKQNGFGGVATAGLVAIWHKLVDNSTQKQKIISGLTETMLERLKRIGAAGGPGYPIGHTVINTQELKIELDKLIMENRVTPYLHTFYTAPLMDGTTVKAVFVENKNGRQAIQARVFVDATGDGDLAKDAGLTFKIREGLQPPTACAHISGLPPDIQKLISLHREEFALAPDHGWAATIPGSPDVRMCALTHVFNTNAADATQLTAAEIEGRCQIRAYMSIARKYGGESYNRPCLLALASYLGIRETRSFKANYTLTDQDVLTCRRFPDAIANGTYPVDVHDPKTGKFNFKQPQGDFYQIPLSAMVNDKAGNIVLAGRSVSAERGAFGGIRVMVNLNQTGEAAGVTAAIAADRQTKVSAIEASIVRDRLSQLGGIIM